MALIPMARGFVYLTGVIDWVSRHVLAAKVAVMLEACHAVDVLNEAFARYGRPQIVNTDQGSQFTATSIALDDLSTETISAISEC